MLIETHIRRSRDDGIYSKIRIFHWYLKHEISIPGKVWHKISFINGFLFWHWRINKLNKEEKIYADFDNTFSMINYFYN